MQHTVAECYDLVGLLLMVRANLGMHIAMQRRAGECVGWVGVKHGGWCDVSWAWDWNVWLVILSFMTTVILTVI